MSVFICIRVSLLLRLSFSPSLCVSALARPGRLYSSFCVSVFIGASLCLYFHASVCICALLSVSVFIMAAVFPRVCVSALTARECLYYSLFLCLYLLGASIRLCFSCLCVRLCTFICVLYLLWRPSSREASVCLQL